MSLLLLNSGSRIATGVLKRLLASGAYNNIILADTYPNYKAVQKSLLNREDMGISSNSKTKIEDVKIAEKSDLVDVIRRASHIVYVTHDYYALAPAKTNLIKTTAQLAKENKSLQSLVALTPIELDHQSELSEVERSEKEARDAYPDLVHLKADIVAGEHGSLMHLLTQRIVNGESIYYSKANGGKQASPVACDDVEASVEAALKDSKHKGKSYLLQGPQKVDLGEIIDTLSKAAKKDAALKSSGIENFISPLSVNLLSEKLYSYEYINAMRFLENYKSPSEGGFGKISELGVTPKEFSKVYGEINTESYKYKSSGSLECAIKYFLYR
eukprot:CAMPEP_0176440764 /NCGR_PEP_ID=MMETSP0127-20121128/20773_1 /TAXON_ID=938130 /ORGANISM="Platyophrya macrostoma, Strain WH" /LENGTH=327 /DNA_ID=CAMNT_0017825367 /DNA_START=50 /DNA_END=1033 /DNA_ORIENTATION=+